MPRPGAYAIVADDAGRLAVVRTPKGLFLPGGGLEPGESPEDTARREAREECGLVLEVGERVGAANEIVHANEEATWFDKQGVFVSARCVEVIAGEGEPHHRLQWIAPADAARGLTHASQRWAVERWIERSSR